MATLTVRPEEVVALTVPRHGTFKGEIQMVVAAEALPKERLADLMVAVHESDPEMGGLDFWMNYPKAILVLMVADCYQRRVW